MQVVSMRRKNMSQATSVILFCVHRCHRDAVWWYMVAITSFISGRGFVFYCQDLMLTMQICRNIDLAILLFVSSLFRQWQWRITIIWSFLLVPHFCKYSLVPVPNLICNEFFYVTYCEAAEAFKLLRWLITVEETQSKNWWLSTDHLTLPWNLCVRSGTASALIPMCVFTSLASFIFLQIGSLNQILSFVPMWTEALPSLWPHHTQTHTEAKRSCFPSATRPHREHKRPTHISVCERLPSCDRTTHLHMSNTHFS